MTSPIGRQVTGYVLIVAVHADYVPLTSLQIIRGKTLFYWEKKNESFSLFVALNYDKNTKNIGLKELRFTSLQGKGGWRRGRREGGRFFFNFFYTLLRRWFFFFNAPVYI